MQRSELELANQRRDTARQDINSLQRQLEVPVSVLTVFSVTVRLIPSFLFLVCRCPPPDDAFVPVLKEYQRKLSQLTPEQQRLSDKLRNMALNNLPGMGWG